MKNTLKRGSTRPFQNPIFLLCMNNAIQIWCNILSVSSRFIANHCSEWCNYALFLTASTWANTHFWYHLLKNYLQQHINLRTLFVLNLRSSIWVMKNHLIYVTCTCSLNSSSMFCPSPFIYLQAVYTFMLNTTLYTTASLINFEKVILSALHNETRYTLCTE